MEIILKWLPTVGAGWIVLNVAIAAMLYGIGSYRTRARKAQRLSSIQALYGLHYQRRKALGGITPNGIDLRNCRS